MSRLPAAHINPREIRFDRIDLQGSFTGSIPNGYAGLLWTNVGVSDTTFDRYDGSGFENGVTSGKQVAYTSDRTIASFAAPEHASFTLESMNLSAAWDTTLKVRIEALNNGELQYAQTIKLTDAYSQHVEFGFQNIDEVRFVPLRGVDDPDLEGEGNIIVFDDVVVSDVKGDSLASAFESMSQSPQHAEFALDGFISNAPVDLMMVHPFA